MKIFVCEYVTGGGLYRDPLPPSLAQEGSLMLEAVLADLAEIPDCEIMISRDSRLGDVGAVINVPVPRDEDMDVWAIWDECILQADAVWPIAPESDGILARLCERVIDRGKVLLASSPEAIRLATSKLATCQTLTTAGVAMVPTTRGSRPPTGNAPWVIKPDDGVSCEGSQIFATDTLLSAWLADSELRHSYVIQPYVAGIPASISMICHKGQAVLLSCNRQLVDEDQQGFQYRGSVLNDMQAYWQEFETLADKVAKAMPGLAGYIGIDVMVTEHAVLLLEVNPRLTTSYAGLRQATQCNPARLILDMFYNGDFPSPPLIERNIVEIRLCEQ